MFNTVKGLCWAALILLAAGAARAGWIDRDTVRFLILAVAALAVATLNRAPCGPQAEHRS